MSSVALLIPPRLQFTDANGKPLAGGKVFTYQAGTTTPQATFVDSLGVIQNSNPVILDGGGFANIWLAAQSYKILVQDKNGVQQWVVDNVQSFNGTIQGTTNLTGTLISSSANPATAGFIRMANGDVFRVRNGANSLDLAVLQIDSADRIVGGDTTGWKFPAFEDTVGITPAPALSSAGIRRRYYDSGIKSEFFSEDGGPFIYRSDPMINQQGPLAEINGNSADQNLYSYQLGAGKIGQGRGIRVTVMWIHTTGAGAITYKFTLGSTVLTSFSDAGTGLTVLELLIFNNTGVQNAQNVIIKPVIDGSAVIPGGPNTSAEDFTTALTLKATFNVAPGDKVTPKMWLVEYA